MTSLIFSTDPLKQRKIILAFVRDGKNGENCYIAN